MDALTWPSIEVLAGNLTRAEPWSNCAGLAACVCQLDHDLLALAVGELNDTLDWLHLRVLPEPNIFRSDAAFGNYSSCLYARETRSALDNTAQVSQVPVGHLKATLSTCNRVKMGGSRLHDRLVPSIDTEATA